MDRESTKVKMKHCKFCNQLNYAKLECEIKKENIKIEYKSKDSIEDNPEKTRIKERSTRDAERRKNT